MDASLTAAESSRAAQAQLAGPSTSHGWRHPMQMANGRAEEAQDDDNESYSGEEDIDDEEEEEEEELGQSFFVRALYSFQSNDASSLSFRKGDIIEVLTQLESGWWDGLLNSEVRGWFPSNYVERIMDDEAEAYIAGSDVSQPSSSRSTGGRYEGLGLANDFDTLRNLMGTANRHDDADAFEQLAEATMSGSQEDLPTKEAHADAAAAKRQSRMSDQSSQVDSSIVTQSDLNSTRSQTDFSSMPSRSAAPSVLDTDLPRKVSGVITGSGSLPEISDRAGSQSASAAGEPFQQQMGRPRAHTNLDMPRGFSQRPGGRIERDVSRLRLEKTQHRSLANESDFWVPKVTDRGDIIYINTRTGAQSRDMPEGIPSPKSPLSPITRHAQRGRAEMDPSGRHASTRFNSTRHGRSSTSHSLASSVRSNHIDRMPDPREVPWPWVVRTSDDETTFHFFNRQTLQTSDDVEEVLGKRLNNLALSDSHHRADGQSHTRSTFTDEADANRLQEAMSAGETCNEIHRAIEEAREDIATLSSMMLEPIGVDGLTDTDRRGAPASTNTMLNSSRLSHAMDKAVRSVRDTLQMASAVGISQSDLVASTELIQLVEDDASLGSFKAFCAAVTALQMKDCDIDNVDALPHVFSGLATALPHATSSNLQPIGRKVCALLSKLVLSARSVMEHAYLNVQERPVISRSQLEKIALYRQKIHDDSTELSHVMQSFEQEVARLHADILGYANASNSSKLMTRSHLRSGRGTSGIGIELLGGGSASGWKGSGFVLPTALETASLRAAAESDASSDYELNLDAQLALSTGKVALRRKPGLQFSAEAVEKSVATAISDFDRHMDGLRNLLEDEHFDILDTRRQAELIECIRSTLTGSGHILTTIEELDLASAFDVDGEELDYHSSAKDSARNQLVRHARVALYSMAIAKQDVYDAGNILLMQTQDLVADRSKLIEKSNLDDLYDVGENLQDSIDILYERLQELVKIHQSQNNDQSPATGLRAKVYGIDDVDVTIGGSATEYKERLDDHSAPSSAGLYRDGTIKGSSLRMPGGKGAVPTRTERAVSHTSAKALKILGDVPPQTPSVSGTDVSDGTHSASGQTNFSSKASEVTPWFLQLDTQPDDIVFSETGQVKGATLPALMERLTMHMSYDPTFNSTFLLTYQSFTTTDELLDLLFARFRIHEPEGLSAEEHSQWVEKKQRPIQLRVFNVLKAWIESHCNENEHDSHLQRIKTFALDEMQQSPFMSSPANLLLRSIERRSGKGEQMKITMVMPASAPPPLLPKNLKKIKFLDIDPLEMARQLTLMDSRLYNSIRPSECLNKSWSRENGIEIAKGIRDVISANNRVSGWVSEAILVQEDLKKRAGWVKHFVAIADRCFYLNNFSSMMAIYSGLNNASLNRLRRTWDAVNQRHLQLFANMRSLLAPTKNFSKYRETLRKLQPPCVPFLGVYLTDLTFIEDGNSDRLRTDERMINFGKRQMTAEKIQEIVIYQSTPYNLTPVAGIQKFIEENLIDARSDDELFEQSLRLEPREREDEKIARLLQESGFL